MKALLSASHVATLVAGLVAGLRLQRRLGRRRLNEATHELRRPLQALALAPANDCRQAWMAQVAGALADLDAQINGPGNGNPRRERSERVALATILEDARRRWAPLAEVEFGAGFPDDGVLRGDRRRVGAALDNLIANAVEHGSGPVSVEAAGSPGRMRLEVVNGRADRSPARGEPEPRRGHGLHAGERVALEHGGRLLAPAPERGARRIRAALELPRIDG